MDGAAIALLLQTGQFEGGYLPQEHLLADAAIEDEVLANATNLTLTSGFNQFGQIALENLLLTANTADTTNVYTFQLEAGHFIATSGSIEEGGHSGHGGSSGGTQDGIVTNLNSNIFPLHLVETNTLVSQANQAYGITRSL